MWLHHLWEVKFKRMGVRCCRLISTSNWLCCAFFQEKIKLLLKLQVLYLLHFYIGKFDSVH